MNTKTCKGCGWVYPITHPETRCRFCGTVFEKRFCPECGAYVKMNVETPMCTDCRNAYQRDLYNYAPRIPLAYDMAVQRFDAWLKMIAHVPKPLKTLTEDEWIAACRYFGSCATCPSESIDARAMLISFDLGGRYAAWNIIPVCDQCATDFKQIQNPFIRHTSGKNKLRARNNFDNTRFEKVIEYLQPILEGASKDG